MFDVKSVDDLWNHIAYVRSYGPNFPHRDFLSDEDQMTLDKAFELLRKGVGIAYPDDFFPEKRDGLLALLNRASAHFHAGDKVAAAHALNDFEDQIFKS